MSSAQAQRDISIPAKIGVTVVLALVVGLGVFLTQRGLLRLEESLAAQSWPTTEGVIVRSAVHTIETPVKEDGREVPNKKTRSYEPEIEYQYTVKGQEFQGTRVTVGDASLGTKASAQAIVDQYPRQKKVIVSYDPINPAHSLLEPGEWASTYRWFVPGTICLLLPLLIFRAMWFGRSLPTPAEVEAHQQHPARSHLLNHLLMLEHILHWEPGQLVHLRRDRVGFVKAIAAGIIVGLVLGIPLGLVPALFFFSGKGLVWIVQFTLIVCGVVTIAGVVGLMLYGRRREYLLDWSGRTILWDIGWSRREASFDQIEKLELVVPPVGQPSNPVVDQFQIRALIQGRSFTLLETNGNGHTWNSARAHLAQVIAQLADSLHKRWSEQAQQK